MMQYQYCPNDPTRYATNLRRELGTRNLKWDNARGQDVLLVQTPFECNAVDIIKELCGYMEKIEILSDQYTEVRPGIWVRFVTASEKAKMGGCPINAEACTYTVFSCSMEQGICSIFAPQNQAMISAYCHIPMELHVSVEEQIRVEGLFRKRSVPTGYYMISFPQNYDSGYMDGDLVYRIREFSIPITKKMLEQGVIYVKTDIKPELISKNKGLKLI